MVLAIEPMVTLGGVEVEILSDGWTAVTKDRLPAAHFEHTVAITEHGPTVLTQRSAATQGLLRSPQAVQTSHRLS
jgi:methionyl aminopeptidase